MPSADEIRDGQRAAWAGLSAGWEKWDSIIMDQLAPVGAAMIERLDIAEDQQHLDIASGTGEPGLSIAKLAPHGRVVLTDLVAEMLDIAARRARAQGDHQHRDARCAAPTICRSTTPRSTACPCASATCSSPTWPRRPPSSRACSSRADVSAHRSGSSPSENPWTSIAMQAIATEAELAPPDPDKPNMFRCAAPGYVSALYEAAGLHDVAEWDVGVELVTESPEQYWDMISEHVSLAVAALQQVDEPARERIRGERHCERECVREERQGPGTGSGALHRRNEAGAGQLVLWHCAQLAEHRQVVSYRPTFRNAIPDEAVHRRESPVVVAGCRFDAHEPPAVPTTMSRPVLHDVVTIGHDDELTPALVRHLMPTHRLEKLARVPASPAGRSGASA